MRFRWDVVTGLVIAVIVFSAAGDKRWREVRKNPAVREYWTAKDPIHQFEIHLIGPIAGRIPTVLHAWDEPQGPQQQLLYFIAKGSQGANPNRSFKMMVARQDSLVFFTGRIEGKQLLWRLQDNLIVRLADGTTRKAAVFQGLYGCTSVQEDVHGDTKTRYMAGCMVFDILVGRNVPTESFSCDTGSSERANVTVGVPRYPIPAGGWNKQAVVGVDIRQQSVAMNR